MSGFAADVQFKPFGTLVNFIPRVSDEGDIVLTVTPEVSQPDFANQVEGVPSFITRRASTSARLRNGETLVVGGLLQDRRVERVRGIPYLMNIPLLGYVFRNTSFDREKTEMLVIVTPRLTTPMAPGTHAVGSDGPRADDLRGDEDAVRPGRGDPTARAEGAVQTRAAMVITRMVRRCGALWTAGFLILLLVRVGSGRSEGRGGRAARRGERFVRCRGVQGVG